MDDRIFPPNPLLQSLTVFHHAVQAGLLNPLALLSPTAAAGGDSAPKSSDQNAAALLAMLQGAGGAPAEAASATAAPASSAVPGTPSKAAKAPKGVTLARGEASYDIGAVAASGRKQTKVTAITIYNTDPGQRPNSLLPHQNIFYNLHGFSSVRPALRRAVCHTFLTACLHDVAVCMWVVYVGGCVTCVCVGSAGYRAGRLIAVSPRYICYGVRGGSVRVIHQTTGQRLLQKGHTTSELADLCIYGEGDSCTLAAIAGNGDLFVWDISIENM